ncbi:MAG: hypothetical protein IJ866_00900 [Alphaproteobacteria bacterium]|nr:hypothetical protein [Alphaproteobacteria bacterium]
MKNNKFWLYYSLATIGLFYTFNSAHGGVRVFRGSYCEEEIGGYYDGGTPTPTQVCNSVVRDLGDGGCSAYQPSSSYETYILEWSGTNYSMGAGALHAIQGCTACYSGDRLLSLSTLCTLKENDEDSWTDRYGAAETIVGWMLDGQNCADAIVYQDAKFCVECNTTSSYGSWTTYNSTNKSVRRSITTTNLCDNTQSTSYQYGCAANTYKYSGSGTAIVCKACPSNATCNSNVGHTDTFTCKSGYTKSGNSCEPNNCPAGNYYDPTDPAAGCHVCEQGYYQPYSKPRGTPCNQCPDYEYQSIEGTQVYPDTEYMGATSITECYIPSVEFSGLTYQDDKGIYEVNEDCYYGS